ncbi:HISTONE-LYSINE N-METHYLTRANSFERASE SUVR5 [Salix viminalis]|uniref:HISTONE-LYSINE N-METHYLTRANSFERASE SUVR5 n=1 Tax=Salix viminalis TaxID=40686 RepID=A0A9Q0UVA3_SALVM|nr:HISTONE-LYSINE N-METHYLTRANSFERASE SUVR5 [Salix viminalis]
MDDGRLNDLLLNVEESRIERQSEGQGTVDKLHVSEHGTSYSDCKVENQRLSRDFGEDDINVQNYYTESYAASENSNLIVDTIESEPNNCRYGEPSLLEPNWLEHDESVALWVKWRGKWQAGIRCARADCPLSTLRAKPTHDRKQYFVIFFPHTRNYSWADMLLVQPINGFPEPIAYKTHKIGLKMVKDLSVARRFIMKKLAAAMLNIVDQFHYEALVDTARDVMVWKEFAMEASRCSGYSDLGTMLLKLQNMILQRYISSDWLRNSFQSWVQQCQVACSAESIELLREELYNSILWNEVDSLHDAPVQSTLGSEWKTWKHEAMKWFSTPQPVTGGGDMEQQNCDSLSPSTISLQATRKRPKLEVRRAETHASQVETSSPLQTTNAEIDSEFFSNRDTVNAHALESELSKEDGFGEVAAPLESPCSMGDRWDGIVVEAGNSELAQKKGVEMTPVNEVLAKERIEPGTSRFAGSSARGEASPVHSPMCEGTTVLGTRCKHRSLPGTTFCKKHRPWPDAEKTSNFPENPLKRKHGEIFPSSDTTYCKEMVLPEQVENPLRMQPVSAMDGDAFHGRKNLPEKLEHPGHDCNSSEMLHCMGSSSLDSSILCPESPKRYSLYCDKHIPSWLKRARNGKSRIISKEVFIDLLKDCSSLQQKLHLHQACELFYKLFKSIFSLRNPVPMEERLKKLWGFAVEEDLQISSSVKEEPAIFPLAIDCSHDDENSIRCKICSKEFLDDKELGNHWMDNHKKEAQWHFRGHACAICLDSFTNRKSLETHVQERHHVEFVEQCMLFQCIPCASHFGNTDQLWLHVLSAHPADFRLPKNAQQLDPSMGKEKEDSLQKHELQNAASMENHTENLGGLRKYICKFCGLKFDLLPDLGRHHQAAHMGPNLFSSRPPKRGVRYYAYRLKSGRLSRPRLKKGLGAVTYSSIRNRVTAGLKKQIQASKSLSSQGLNIQSNLTEAGALGRLAESQCSAVAKILFSEVQKTKPRPNNLDILAIARTACCKVSLKASLEGKYGVLPERFYLKAAKLCSEHNIQVQWHREGVYLFQRIEWKVDECHYIIDVHDVTKGPKQKATILCTDISFGKETIPVACVVDEDLLDSLHVVADGFDGQISTFPKPWDTFTYVTGPVHDQCDNLDIEGLELRCSCQYSMCCPETCDHVYLFDNDYEDAKDIYGKSMLGRFPYDNKGRLVLELSILASYGEASSFPELSILCKFFIGLLLEEYLEGYLVYECNSMCNCNKTCPNRVLQNGIRVKLEVFKTDNKGWAVRAGEPILRSTFICEYIGEVLNEQEASNRRDRYGKEGCSYIYKIDAHTNDMSRMVEGQAHYFIDSTKYGNVSRFINHR